MPMPRKSSKPVFAAAPEAEMSQAAGRTQASIDLWRRYETAVSEQDAGRLEAAERAFSEILADYDAIPGVLSSLGLLAARRGDHARAVELFRKAISVRPAEAAYHVALGQAYVGLGRLDSAADAFEAAIRLEPRHKAALCHLGLTRLAKGRQTSGTYYLKIALSLALAQIRKHIRLAPRLWWTALWPGKEAAGGPRAPRTARVEVGRGLVFQKAGELEKAISCYRKALSLAPDHPVALRGCGTALLDSGGGEFGAVLLERAVELAPGDAGARCALGHALSKLGRQDEAIAQFRAALGIDPDLLSALDGIGFAYEREGQIAEAAASWRRSLELDPNAVRARLGLAQLNLQLGRIEQAESDARRVLEAEPASVEALAFLCGMRKIARDSELFSRIEALLQRTDLTRHERTALNFAASWVYRDSGDADAAFAHLKLANDLVDMACDPDADAAEVDGIIGTFTPEFLAAEQGFGDDSEVPIFIVGMPRSGTTLVEQIIASHPRAHGGGELKKIHRIQRDLPKRLGTRLPYPRCARLLDRATAAQLGREYVAYLRSFDDEALRITDKMPSNFLHLGLISVLLPRARVIHCRRDPLDTCLSIYFLNFAEPQPFAYDLTHLGLYYRQYQRLMDHWRRTLPLPVLEVPYEDLVADHHAMTRKIVEFAGLEWDERCLDFHSLDRRVSTSSKWQVRQPIYKTAVARWRKYEKHLGPLKEALGS